MKYNISQVLLFLATRYLTGFFQLSFFVIISTKDSHDEGTLQCFKCRVWVTETGSTRRDPLEVHSWIEIDLGCLVLSSCSLCLFSHKTTYPSLCYPLTPWLKPRSCLGSWSSSQSNWESGKVLVVPRTNCSLTLAFFTFNDIIFY